MVRFDYRHAAEYLATRAASKFAMSLSRCGERDRRACICCKNVANAGDKVLGKYAIFESCRHPSSGKNRDHSPSNPDLSSQRDGPTFHFLLVG